MKILLFHIRKSSYRTQQIRVVIFTIQHHAVVVLLSLGGDGACKHTNFDHLKQLSPT